MSHYLMTHSLLASWLYAMKENPFEDATNERDPMEEFMLVLRREPTPVTEAMQKGTDFENLVTDILNGVSNTSSNWYDAAKRVADMVQGGIPQHKVSKGVEISGMRVLLYGRLDFLKSGRVIDIKFSSKYERGKYFSSTQHPMYMELVPEATDFTYIVSNGSEVWTENYRRDETHDIRPVVSDFYKWLTATGLMELYKEKWKSR